MKIGIATAGMFCCNVILASVPIPATIEELARGADHILVGHVVGVDMVDEQGKPVSDESARTGPGLKNTIRLQIMVDEVLVTNHGKKFPKTLKVPLDPMMHYSLGQIRQAHAKPSPRYLVLLKGANFLPVIPGAILRRLEEKEAALRIHAETHRAPGRTTPSSKPASENGPGAE